MTDAPRSAQSFDVWITGIGAVTPLGPTLSASWDALIAGQNAAGPVTLFPTDGCRINRAAQIRFNLEPNLPARALRRLSRASRLALLAADEALAAADLPPAARAALPLALSTNGGAMECGEHFVRDVLAARRPSFAQLSRYQPQAQALDLTEHLNLKGPCFLVANACASGANALGHAFDWIRSGAVPCVLAGAYEALTELIYVGFDCLQALSPDLCRPFDQHRTGLLLGEGAAFFVLESRDHAARRGALPWAQLVGYGHSTDLHHLTQPDPHGRALARALSDALAQAALLPSDLAYLNAHGTGTPVNDPAEAASFQAVFQSGHWPRISSTKSAIGHALGAAGALEAAFAVQALRTGSLPPQLHQQRPLDIMAPHLIQPGESAPAPRAVASVNLGFGGSNAALVFRRGEIV